GARRSGRELRDLRLGPARPRALGRRAGRDPRRASRGRRGRGRGDPRGVLRCARHAPGRLRRGGPPLPARRSRRRGRGAWLGARWREARGGPRSPRGMREGNDDMSAARIEKLESLLARVQRNRHAAPAEPRRKPSTPLELAVESAELPLPSEPPPAPPAIVEHGTPPAGVKVTPSFAKVSIPVDDEPELVVSEPSGDYDVVIDG